MNTSGALITFLKTSIHLSINVKRADKTRIFTFLQGETINVNFFIMDSKY